MVIILTYKHRWYHRLRWKLFISCLFISFAPLMFFAGTISNSTADYYISQKKDELKRAAIITAGNISSRKYLTDESARLFFDYELDEASRQRQFRIIVFDADGVVVNDSSRIEIGNKLFVPEALEALGGREVAALQPDNEVIRAAAFITNETGEITGSVLIVASVADIYAPIRDIEGRLWIVLAVVAVVIMFFIFFISQVLIDPLQNVVRAVQRMSEGRLDARALVKGKDEFAELGDSFNIMAKKLELVENTREEFVSNVSHELKTPLSSMKVLSESILIQENAPEPIYKEFLHDISSEVDRMTLIVDNLLSLVKLDDRETGLDIAQVDLNRLLTDILKRMSPIAEKKNIELTYENIKKTVIEADEMKLSLAVTNLIENGVKYTPEGGTVRVVLDADHQNAFITVQDTGIGISDEEQAKVFNRFYRVDKTRDRETGGTGLGLSITHATVLLHDGHIRLTSREREGSSFIVRLPIHHAG